MVWCGFMGAPLSLSTGIKSTTGSDSVILVLSFMDSSTIVPHLEICARSGGLDLHSVYRVREGERGRETTELCVVLVHFCSHSGICVSPGSSSSPHFQTQLFKSTSFLQHKASTDMFCVADVLLSFTINFRFKQALFPLMDDSNCPVFD